MSRTPKENPPSGDRGDLTSATKKNPGNKPDNAPGNAAANTPRLVAVRTLMAVTLKKRPFDAALDDMAAQAGLNARDRAFAFNLVMLSLRQLGVLRFALNGLLDRGLPKNATWTEAALITGLAQILFMRTSDHAAVNETVAMIKGLSGKEQGFTGLVNAVLRKAIRTRDTLITKTGAAPENNLPKWLQESWTGTYGEEGMRALALSLAENPPLDISLKPDVDQAEWAEKLEARVLPTGSLRRSATDVPSLPGYEDGLWWVQDMAAAIPATLLGDIAGNHILDLCAAPGGKTMQLAAAGARVTAVDRSKNRMQRLKANLKRTGLDAELVVGDAATFKPATPADHILLDAPCSATGTLRRNPDVLWTKEPADVEKLTALQARILRHAFTLLPVGGTLIYCVCSLEKSEGPDQIAAFLSETNAACRQPIGTKDVGGLTDLITPDGDLLCLPSFLPDDGGMDGFFAARLTKQF